MTTILDRRASGNSKSVENKEKFKQRHERAISDAIKKIIHDGSIKDMTGEKKIKIPNSDEEPTLSSEQGTFDRVFIGNKKYRKGDTIPKPQQGEGNGRGKGSNSDEEGLDPFEFILTEEEFERLLFQELEIPFLTKKIIPDLEEFEYKNAGFQQNGLPANLSVIRSFKNGLARNIAMEAAFEEEIEELKKTNGNEKTIVELEELKKTIPFLDDMDLRYRFRNKHPVPRTRAVMFCVMDVSGSMDQEMKDRAKRFYLLLFLFLKNKYEKFEVVFMRHHTQAKICTENVFFNERITGGTAVSSALELLEETIQKKYNPTEYNIYVAQATDGDNFEMDNGLCRTLLRRILPSINYFMYIQVQRYRSDDYHSAVITKLLSQFKNLVECIVLSNGDVFPVFAKMFAKKSTS